MPTPFVNEPLSNFGDPAVADRMQQAIDEVRGELGREYPLVIDGEKVKTSATIASLDPSNPGTVVGRVAEGSREHAERALNAALERFKSWQHVAPEERASYLFKA
ncbi:MAG TPA: aldehyde dehydrogenase family protein, partial [Candidatus Krumholzibacteria bacterium]|nr:aldehyde dehydrogenase family protein [Candidatus Krumholzibacteria bacterium]